MVSIVRMLKKAIEKASINKTRIIARAFCPMAEACKYLSPSECSACLKYSPNILQNNHRGSFLKLVNVPEEYKEKLKKIG